MMESNSYKEYVDKIHADTGYDKSIINCWYSSYQSPSCNMLRGSCKNICICQHLENYYKQQQVENHYKEKAGDCVE